MAYSVITGDFGKIDEGCPGTIGSQYYNFTRAYSPGSLMTLPRGCEYHGVTDGKRWEVLRIQDLMNPPQNWISSNGCLFDHGFGGMNAGLNPNGTEMAATPLLSFPQDILSMDPIWASRKCVPFDAYNFGLWDPPRILTPVAAVGPATTTLSPHSRMSKLDPAPASTPAVIPVSKTTLLALPGMTQLSPTLEPVQAQPTVPNKLSGKDPIISQSPVDVPDTKSSNHQSIIVNTAQAIATVDGKPVYVIPNADISVHDTVVRNGDPAVTDEKNTVSVNPESIFVSVFSHHLPSLIIGNEQAPKTVAGEVLSAAQSHAIVLGGNIIQPGKQTTIDGTWVSVGQDHIIINTRTYAIPSAASLNDPLPSAGGQPIKVGPEGAIIVNGSTIYPGQLTAIGGDTISLESSKVIINSKTYAIPTPSSSLLSNTPNSNPPAVIGGAVLKGSDDGEVFVGDSLVAPGQHTDIHGTRISVDSDYMVIGSITYSKPTAKPTALLDAYSALASIDPSVTIAKDGAIVAGDSIISVGQKMTISSVYLSVASDSLVVGSRTYKLPEPQPTDGEKAQSALAALAGTENISINPNGEVLMGDSTLLPGFQTTISGDLISIASDKIVIGASTYALSDGPKISTAPNGDIIIDHYTLSKGESTTISGQVVEVDSSNVVIAGTTYPFPRPTSAEPLGLIIASMLGYAQSATPGDSHSPIAEADETSRPSLTTTNTADPIANLSLFTGAQTSSSDGISLKVCPMVLCICVGTIFFGF